MTSAQVVETSVTNNSSFQNYTHPDDHTIRTVVLETTTAKGWHSNKKAILTSLDTLWSLFFSMSFTDPGLLRNPNPYLFFFHFLSYFFYFFYLFIYLFIYLFWLLCYESLAFVARQTSLILRMYTCISNCSVCNPLVKNFKWSTEFSNPRNPFARERPNYWVGNG